MPSRPTEHRVVPATACWLALDWLNHEPLLSSAGQLQSKENKIHPDVWLDARSEHLRALHHADLARAVISCHDALIVQNVLRLE